MTVKARMLGSVGVAGALCHVLCPSLSAREQYVVLRFVCLSSAQNEPDILPSRPLPRIGEENGASEFMIASFKPRIPSWRIRAPPNHRVFWCSPNGYVVCRTVVRVGRTGFKLGGCGPRYQFKCPHTGRDIALSGRIHVQFIKPTAHVGYNYAFIMKRRDGYLLKTRRIMKRERDKKKKDKCFFWCRQFYDAKL